MSPLMLRISVCVSLFLSSRCRMGLFQVRLVLCFLIYLLNTRKNPASHTWCSECGNKVESVLSLRDCREASISGLRAPAPPLETLPGNNTNRLGF